MNDIFSITVYATLKHSTHAQKCVAIFTKDTYK